MSSVSKPVFEGFPPIGATGKEARTLVLGSFPSVRSAARGEYYGHERNHFWPILFSVLEEGSKKDSTERSYDEKCALAGKHGIVIWDMVRSCRRTNSSDAELEVLELNDVVAFLEAHPSVVQIGLNGGRAAALFLEEIARHDREAGRCVTDLRGIKHALSSTGGIARLWIGGRARRVYRLPSTSPVPTQQFRSIDDKMPLWARFLHGDDVENFDA